MLHKIYNNSHTLCMCKQHNTCQQLESSLHILNLRCVVLAPCWLDSSLEKGVTTPAARFWSFLSCPDMKPFAICPRGRDNPEFPAIRKPSAWCTSCPWWPWCPWQAWTSDFLASMIQDMISTGLTFLGLRDELGILKDTEGHRNANKNLFPTVKAFKMLHFQQWRKGRMFLSTAWCICNVDVLNSVLLHLHIYNITWYNMAWCDMDI